MDAKVLRMRTREAARYICLAPRTLEHYRRKGTGPAYSRLGRIVVYSVNELDRWVESHLTGPSEPSSRLDEDHL